MKLLEWDFVIDTYPLGFQHHVYMYSKIISLNEVLIDHLREIGLDLSELERKHEDNSVRERKSA